MDMDMDMERVTRISRIVHFMEVERYNDSANITGNLKAIISRIPCPSAKTAAVSNKI